MTFLQLKNVVNALPDDMDESVFYNLYRQLHHTGYVDTDGAVDLAEKRLKKLKEFARRMIPLEPHDYKRDETGVYARCPACNEFVVDTQNFCSYCGTKLDWDSIPDTLCCGKIQPEDEE